MDTKGSFVSTSKRNEVLNENRSLVNQFVSQGNKISEKTIPATKIPSSSPSLFSKTTAFIADWKHTFFLPCYIVSSLFIGKSPYDKVKP